MINDIVLVGKIEKINEITDKKREIKLEIERPFDEKKGRNSDIITCQLWHSIFSKVVSVCAIGDLLAVRGRLVNEKEKFFVVAEKVVLLNKKQKNILKEE